MLAEADKLRVAMLTSLSHDLRTPLASILGAATTLCWPTLAYMTWRRPGDLLATIRDEAERLDRFVGNLLDMSRLEAGALGTKPESVDCPMRLGSRDQAPGAAGCSPHAARSDLPTTCPWSSPIRCCWSRVWSTCWTMPRNMRRPERESASGARHGDRIVITVEDEGPGIAPELAAHLRQILPRRRSRPPRRGNGVGPRRGAWFRRILRRHAGGGQPQRRQGRDAHHVAPAQQAAERRMAQAAQDPDRRRRAADPPLPARQLAAARLRLYRGGGCRGALAVYAKESPDVISRSRPARPGRFCGDPGDPKAGADAHRRAVRAQRRRGQGQGAGAGRGRLCHQALRHERAAGAPEGGAAPWAAGGGRGAGVPHREL